MKSTKKIVFFFGLISILFGSQGCLNMKIQRAQKLQVLKAIREGQPTQQVPGEQQSVAPLAPCTTAPQTNFYQPQSIPTIQVIMENINVIPNNSYTRSAPVYTCFASKEGQLDIDEHSALADDKYWIVTMVRVDAGFQNGFKVPMKVYPKETYSVAVPVKRYKELKMPNAVFTIVPAGRVIAAEGKPKEVYDPFRKRTYKYVNDEGTKVASFYLQ